LCKRVGEKIQIQILTGRKIIILIDPYYDQLSDIKKKIQVKEGIHPDQQILFYNGIRLQEDNSTSLRDVLCTSNADEDDTDTNNSNTICLFLTLRNRGG
jgi:Ubiquitin family